LAEDIKAEFDIEVKLSAGKLHSFDVFVNGELIFSKAEEERFPESREIIDAISLKMDG
jgi:selT/selW/selH-like putative selenoprotein